MDDGVFCVFGGTGFLGRRIVRHLRDHGCSVRVASRQPGRTLFFDRDLVEPIRADIEDEHSVAAAVAGARGVVNAVSLYVERGDRTFRSMHVEAATRLAAQARGAGVEHLVHISGIGADPGSDSPYIRSRGEGELAVQAAFPGAKIIRPADTFGPDYRFFYLMLILLQRPPGFPMCRAANT